MKQTLPTHLLLPANLLLGLENLFKGFDFAMTASLQDTRTDTRVSISYVRDVSSAADDH